jgi:hypothetical protein
VAVGGENRLDSARASLLWLDSPSAELSDVNLAFSLPGKTSDVGNYIIDLLRLELAKGRHHRSFSNSSSAFGYNVVQKRVIELFVIGFVRKILLARL